MERQFSQVTSIRYRRRIQFLNHYFRNPVNTPISFKDGFKDRANYFGLKDRSLL